MRRPLVGLLSAEAVSFTGTRMSVVAIPWFVLTTTGSAAAMGLVTFAEMAPLVTAKALGGPIIDRVGPRRVSVVSDVASAGVVGLIPTLHALGLLQFWVLVVLVAVAGAARGPGDASKSALVPDVVAGSGTALERVTGLVGSVDRLSQMVGPLLAGVLVAGFGSIAVIVVDAATFAVAALIVSATIPVRARPTDPGAEPTSYVDQLRAGFEFLRDDRLLRAIVGMVAVTNLVDVAVMTVLLPVWARDHGHGPAVVGVVLGVLGAFAVGGSVVAAVVAHRLPKRTTYLVAQVVSGGPHILVLALGGPLWIVLAAWAVTGVAGGLINPVIGALVYERIPAPMLGRVSTLASAAAYAGIPIGALLGGVLVSGVGLVPTVVGGFVVYLAATVVPLRRPEWQEMDDARGGVPAADRLA